MRRFAAHGGVPFRVAISPDAKSIAYVQRVSSNFSLWLGQVETNSSVLVEDRPGILYNAITFARDGQTIYITETDATSGATRLVRMPAIGGASTEVASLLGGAVAFLISAMTNPMLINVVGMSIVGYFLLQGIGERLDVDLIEGRAVTRAQHGTNQCHASTREHDGRHRWTGRGRHGGRLILAGIDEFS